MRLIGPRARDEHPGKRLGGDALAHWNGDRSDPRSANHVSVEQEPHISIDHQQRVEAPTRASLGPCRLSSVIERSEVVAAHRELVEASNAVRHLLVVDDLTQDKIDAARGRLTRAYERANAVDERVLIV
jgi:hypothetical protein